MTLKIIGHLFYSKSSFVHHFKAMGEFELELQSGNSQFESKSIFLSCVTFKFDKWPWKTIGHLFYTMSSIVHHYKAIGDFRLQLQSGNAQFGSKLAIFFVLCDLEIWWITLKNNRAPVLYYIKLCVIFKGISEFKLELQSISAQFGSKLAIFLSCVTLKFVGWHWKTIGHLFYPASSFLCIIS